MRTELQVMMIRTTQIKRDRILKIWMTWIKCSCIWGQRSSTSQVHIYVVTFVSVTIIICLFCRNYKKICVALLSKHENYALSTIITSSKMLSTIVTWYYLLIRKLTPPSWILTVYRNCMLKLLIWVNSKCKVTSEYKVLWINIILCVSYLKNSNL